mgnify:CR=1 FL=1
MRGVVAGSGAKHVRTMDETSAIGSGYDDHVEHRPLTT